MAFKPPDYSEINVIAENSYEDFTENVYVDAGTQVEITCIKDANITGESLLTCQDDGKLPLFFRNGKAKTWDTGFLYYLIVILVKKMYIVNHFNDI